MRIVFLLLFPVAACAPPPEIPSNIPAPSAPDDRSATEKEAVAMDPRIWCMHQGANGDLWFGSNGDGVYRHDGQRLTHYTSADGLIGTQVRDIKQHANGNVLIATTTGITLFDGVGFSELKIESPTDGDGWGLDPEDVWILLGPGNDGPCRYDGERLYQLELSKSPAEDAYRQKNPGSSFKPDGVYSIFKDSRGHVWFGTAAVGLCRYDGAIISWMYEEDLTTTPSGGSFGIRSVYEDTRGDFWIGNTRQRFSILSQVSLENGYSLIDYEKKDGMPDAHSDTGQGFTYFSSMAEDDTGDLWMACGRDGAWKFDGEGIAKHSIGDGAFVISIYRDRDGKIWAGTVKQGVHLFDGVGFAPFEPGMTGD